jgi:hypothetical protein
MLARFRKKVRSRLFRALGIVRSRQEVTFFRAFRPLAVAICANAIANVATEAREKFLAETERRVSYRYVDRHHDRQYLTLQHPHHIYPKSPAARSYSFMLASAGNVHASKRHLIITNYNITLHLPI